MIRPNRSDRIETAIADIGRFVPLTDSVRYVIKSAIITLLVAEDAHIKQLQLELAVADRDLFELGLRRVNGCLTID